MLPRSNIIGSVLRKSDIHFPDRDCPANVQFSYMTSPRLWKNPHIMADRFPSIEDFSEGASYSFAAIVSPIMLSQAMTQARQKLAELVSGVVIHLKLMITSWLVSERFSVMMRHNSLHLRSRLQQRLRMETMISWEVIAATAV